MSELYEIIDPSVSLIDNELSKISKLTNENKKLKNNILIILLVSSFAVCFVYLNEVRKNSKDKI